MRCHEGISVVRRRTRAGPAHPRKLKLGQVLQALEEDFALVECFGPNDQRVLTGGCGLEAALAQAMQNFFRELDRYSPVDASPALSALPMWQPITWAQPRAPLS